MSYALLIISAILIAANFITNKVYQKNEGATVESSLKFNVLSALFTVIIFLIINKFQIEFNGFSFLMSFITTCCCVAYTIIGFKIIKEGQVALYTFFLMTGGMLVPYLLGVLFLNEQITFLRILGLIIITISVFLVNPGIGKTGGKTVLMCISVFFLNGFVSVFSKLHQIYPMAISSSGFVLLGGIIKFLCCYILYYFIAPKRKKDTAKTVKSYKRAAVVIAFVSAFISGVSYLFQLMGAKEIDATVLYPIITGGSIFFTTVAGWMFLKEKPTKKMVFSVIMCFVGTCMFL